MTADEHPLRDLGRALIDAATIGRKVVLDTPPWPRFHLFRPRWWRR